jgi:6-phosphogluconate dehydrogenase
MVHNGIEYGDMQLISEVYDILKVSVTWFRSMSIANKDALSIDSFVQFSIHFCYY